MNVQNQIPVEWQHWLHTNLLRNVPDKTLLDVMVEKQFNPDLVTRCITAIKSRGLHTLDARNIKPSPLTGDWQYWLKLNIEAGVLEQTLIDTASQHIRAAWAARSALLREQGESAEYTYDDHASFGKQVVLSDRVLPVLMAHERPQIALFGNFMSKDECAALIALAKPQMAPSVLLDQSTARPMVTAQRTSNGTHFRRGETPLIQMLEQRIAELTGCPAERGEGIQILHYAEGGEYRPHYDFFAPEQPSSSNLMKNGGQRVATLIAYLNTVEEGGDTIFPKLDIKIMPIQGNALYFSYTNSKQALDRSTLHGGMPVIKGEKWIMTKWMRQNEIK